MQFKTCELFIFRIFHFTFLNHGLLEVIESSERKRRPLQFFFLLILKILNYSCIFLKKLVLFWLKNCKDKKVRLYCRKFRAAFATLLLEGNLESPSETDSCLVKSLTYSQEKNKNNKTKLLSWCFSISILPQCNGSPFPSLLVSKWAVAMIGGVYMLLEYKSQLSVTQWFWC